MRLVGLFAVLLLAGALVSVIPDLPDWGDVNSPPNSHLSPTYITQVMEETSVPNIVTAVLADYRGFDTMLETTVVLIGGLAILVLLRHFRRERRKQDGAFQTDLPPNRPNQIIMTTCRLMVPPIQLFALYVVAHGHHSPGGGFQGGVIFGASLILLALSYNMREVLNRINESMLIVLSCVGVLIFAGAGILSLALGANFLDYSAWHPLMMMKEEVGRVAARSLGMLIVEIGVAFTVTCIMFSIYFDLAARSEWSEED